jgi:UDP-glucose 4-epimerase
MKILVTGGLGYIGSNMTLELLKLKNKVIVLDNLSNSNKSVINKIKKLTRENFVFFKVDCKNKTKVFNIFKNEKPDLVIHFAGLKSVSESVKKPSLYLKENIKSAETILLAMKKFNVTKFIFSSSATVYGEPVYLPIDEKHPTEPLHAYGLSKLKIEKILNNISKKNKKFSIISLRYFNPVGSDDSGTLSDNPKKPTNLFPNILNVVKKKKKFLSIWGKDYKTDDGTAARDFIHIKDLIEAHIYSISYIKKIKGHKIFNVGTGKSHTVLKVVRKFKSINKLNFLTKFRDRRAGDTPEIFASVKKINKSLKWKSKYSLSEMCKIK